MGSGFVRRYGFNPGTNVITLIEGVIILDLAPPGQIAGIASGVACLVAEFADATYGISVDQSGNVTQNPNPVQIFSGQDLINKTGGFDPTIGDFGSTMGNGFVELRNKSYSQLVVVPVPIVASKGIRLWRDLPHNQSLTNPQPFVPMQGASLSAATPLVYGSTQVNTAQAKQFTGLQPYLYGTDGAITPSTGATEAFTSASSNFPLAGVAVGDAIVLGAPLSSALLSSPTGGAYIGATDTFAYLAVPGWTGYPAAGLLKIDSEQLTYSGVTSGVSGTAFTGLTRGVNSTVGATHAVGAVAVGLNNVGTYRVNAVQGATALLLERQDGSNFATTTSFGASGAPWRLHKASDADTAAGIIANAATYATPVRPFASVPTGAALAPLIVAPIQSYNSWDPLSGLAGKVAPSIGLVYDPTTMAPNVTANASLDALYLNAIAALQSQDLPEATVNLAWASRKSTNIRQGLRSSVDNESAIGVGRMAVIAPGLQEVTSTSQAVATTSPGVGGVRDERVVYTWPGVTTYVPEAVNIAIKGADGNIHLDGIIDMPTDGWLVAVMSNINPEWNPGQASAPVPQVLSPITGLARNAPATLGINDYIAMKQAGICGIRIDRTVGPVFQSGVTTSLVPGQTTIQRRRMADFCEDSVADALAPLAKQPATLLWQDNVLTEITSFLEGLQSPNNPAQQRINGYYVDPKGGNTFDLNAQGIYVWIIGVQMTPTADFIVLQFNVGNSVVIPTQLQ